jgi:hypothetical protein
MAEDRGSPKRMRFPWAVCAAGRLMFATKIRNGTFVIAMELFLRMHCVGSQRAKNASDCERITKQQRKNVRVLAGFGKPVSIYVKKKKKQLSP